MHAMRHLGLAAARRSGLVVAALALLGLAGCVAYPAGYYGYGYPAGGGYYAPAPAYVYAPPPVVGGVYIGGGGGGYRGERYWR